MASNKAWQHHGCYHVGSDSLFDLPLMKASLGCQDDWNSLDHFDPTTGVQRLFKQLFDLRANYRSLNNGFSLDLLRLPALLERYRNREGFVECFQGRPPTASKLHPERHSLDVVHELEHHEDLERQLYEFLRYPWTLPIRSSRPQSALPIRDLHLRSFEPTVLL